MALTTSKTTFRAIDGLRLSGTLATAETSAQHAVVLVHGGGVTREEGGFFTRLAEGLGEAELPSLRYDQRGHGSSDGEQETRTLAEHLNDITSAIEHLQAETGATTISLLGASFGGGLAAYYAAKRPDELHRLVLLNPQLNYKDRYINQKPHWVDGHLDEPAAETLREQGYLDHSSTVKHSRAFLNEVFWIRPNEVMSEIALPTLIVHGTKDTFVPIESSRAAAAQLPGEHRLVEIDGAQHGFAVDKDPEYQNPQTQEWQAFVIRTVTDWLTD
ncbi:alpha/beta hydrolase [Amycolatopsis sp. H20-H5]|uniref:alpha/beta hydrolase n=1 Tax=Amycolatopsis sp. H20-H5 TaxID=3046309 RepID=UPI002DB86A74|nr:alpha/beta fold hydrolase [Amycolatopsis sp. H20-H5]MEC3978162.1 alpha/beta fold hydrolase [Amycolatopsis sp. H20-H5]